MVSTPKGGVVFFKKSYLLFAFSDVNIKDTIMKLFSILPQSRFQEQMCALFTLSCLQFGI